MGNSIALCASNLYFGPYFSHSFFVLLYYGIELAGRSIVAKLGD